MEFSSDNYLRVAIALLISFAIVVSVVLLIHYWDKIIKYCCKNNKIHSEVSICNEITQKIELTTN